MSESLMKLTRKDMVTMAGAMVLDELRAERQRLLGEQRNAIDAFRAYIVDETLRNVGARLVQIGADYDKLQVEVDLVGEADRNDGRYRVVVRDGSPATCDLMFRRSRKVVPDTEAAKLYNQIADASMMLDEVTDQINSHREMEPTARSKAINALLDELPQGEAVRDALAKFSAALKKARL